MAITISGSGIVEANLADNAVTLAKMASGTDGEILTYDASGNPTSVSVGTDGQVLTSTGAGSPPAFETAAAGGKVIGHSITKISTGFFTTSTTTSTVMSATYTPVSTSSTIVVRAVFVGYLEGNVSAQGLKGAIYRGSTDISGNTTDNWVQYRRTSSGWTDFMASQIVTGVSTGHSTTSYTWAFKAAITGGGDAFSTYADSHKYIEITEYS
jgi:hypothetical protein